MGDLWMQRRSKCLVRSVSILITFDIVNQGKNSLLFFNSLCPLLSFVYLMSIYKFVNREVKTALILLIGSCFSELWIADGSLFSMLHTPSCILGSLNWPSQDLVAISCLWLMLPIYIFSWRVSGNYVIRLCVYEENKKSIKTSLIKQKIIKKQS